MVKPAIRGADSMSKDGMKPPPAHAEQRPSSSQLPTPYRPAHRPLGSLLRPRKASIRSRCASASPETQLVAFGTCARDRQYQYRKTIERKVRFRNAPVSVVLTFGRRESCARALAAGRVLRLARVCSSQPVASRRRQVMQT